MDAIRNFSWIIDGELAGMACPYFADTEPGDSPGEDVQFLREAGVRALVGLTAGGPSQNLARAFGFDYLFIPVPDMTPPSMDQLEQAVRFIDAMRRQGKATAVFCGAGYGRTGTVLAAYLVSLGREPGEAIAEVRTLRPHSIETVSQEQAIADFSFHLRDRRNDAAGG